MAAPESVMLKVVVSYFPSLIGAVLAVLLDPPKTTKMLPVLIVSYAAIGEAGGPLLQDSVSWLNDHPELCHIAAAALGWTILKLLRKLINGLDATALLPSILTKKQ